MTKLLPRLFALLALGCNPPTFDPPSLVRSARILAVSADPPYAMPGETVNMTALAFDGRASPAAPMQLYFLPVPCVNPPGDAYYGCFPPIGALVSPGVDLGPILNLGPDFSFQMPADALIPHVDGGDEPYGLAVVFTIACAGHVEYAPPPRGASPDTVPFGCFDDRGHRLGADDFVFAYSLVYAFQDRINRNPAIEQVTFAGAPVDATAGITLEHCPGSGSCPKQKLDVVVPRTSQEADPTNLDTEGHPLGELIYVKYYVTGGKVANDTMVLFDPRRGRLVKTGDDYRAPELPGEYRLWVVVHDNRGGVAWQEIALHVL
jgi:hypothetical protein